MQRLENLITQLKHKIRDVETAIIQLKSGFMPSTMVSYKRLTKVLMNVKSHLNPGLTLGIPIDEIERYYTLPFSSFKQMANTLVIRMIVPISDYYDKDPLSVYRPIFHPFPSPPKWSHRFNTTAGFIQIMEKDALWCFKNRKLEWVTETKYLTCQTKGDWRSCYTFQPKFQAAKTPCVERLVREQYGMIDKYCSLEFGADKVYRPIPVSPQTYVVHKHSTLNYFQACGNETAMSSIELAKSAGKVAVGFNCTFVCNGRDFYGPGPRQMDSANTIIISGPIVAKDQELDSLSAVVTLEVETLPLVEASDLEVKPQMKEALAELEEMKELKLKVRRSLKVSENATRMLANLPPARVRGWTMKNLLLICESLIFYLLALLLLLSAVRSGIYMCVPPVTFTVLQAGVDALPITDPDSFPYNIMTGNWIPFDSNDLIDFLPIAKIIIFSLILIVLWTRFPVNESDYEHTCC